jgi:(E)-4-hydroxy-3-methylbut-2-enyl-diphosphate synthase
MTVDLGMPRTQPRSLGERRKSRQLMVGTVPVGGGAPVTVQSMTTTLTANVNATLQQIAELTAAGCQIVRVAVPSQDDADALPDIARKAQIPVIADIHFQPKYVFAAIDAGCAAVRVNPGNIKYFDDKVAEIAKAASAAGTPIRIGVNAGSLDRRLLARYGSATPDALVESALWECSLFEEHGFTDIKISVKHHDPVVMVQAYRQLAERCDYPLHLGVTEAGPAFQGRSSRRWRSVPCWPRASATPSGCRCRRRRSRRSRSASPSWSRSACASAAWKSCPARRVAGRKSTSTRWPKR